jgi:transcriptional regulator with XRE-family HTH domain
VPKDLAADVGRAGFPEVGKQLRERRLALDLSVRELARRLNVSPSLISQIERGKATPSVGTLYSMTTELGLSMGTLFSETGDGDSEATFQSALTELQAGDRNGSQRPTNAFNPVVGPDERKQIQLDSGVIWERLTPASDANVDFLEVLYQPGGASCDANALVRHSGREYGHVLSGTLGVTLSFDTYVLGPGHSISFESTIPHRLATIGSEPVRAIWFVVGRLGDSRHTGG